MESYFYSLFVISDNTNNGTKIEEVNNLFVYPNPSNSNQINLSKISSGTIVDVLGNEVLEFNYTNSIDLSNLSNGIYFVKTTNGECIKFILEK